MENMFEKVLVANRGEIAVRVMRACEELSIETVAVYSDADEDSGHVRYADEAYNVGPAQATESYLDHDAILDTAERAGADAIHPGYGFLAENAEFAGKVEGTEGVTWVGPSAESMSLLGEKTSARQTMRESDVPIVPGTMEPADSAAEVKEFGNEHGYPVAIKAESGGGGRGMKIVRDPKEADDQFESAQREGKAYFDNINVYLERYIKDPRHVEVQIIADEHGNVRHLGERDCSLQRRHQKIIEEGPSPALTDGLREQISEAAHRGADAAGYYNAGTFEFLVEDDRDCNANDLLGADTDFYFLEVNTRIQVEHTVTEELTGIDIVKWQLRVAAGEELDFAQDDVTLDGHAIEYRINAENAAADFAPATGGSLVTYDPPGGFGVRVDDALRQGDELVTDYDSMVAKLIVHASDREEAIARSERALAEYDIHGIPTVVPFHRLMIEDEAFVAGKHTTKYLDEYLASERIDEAQQKWGTETEAGSTSQSVASSEYSYTVQVENRQFNVNLQDLGPVSSEVSEAAKGSPAENEPAEDSEENVSNGETITAEMQGTILSIDVSEGDKVESGDVICVLEAMKMENDIVARTGGTVTEVAVTEEESVNMGDVLIVLK